MNEFTEEQLSDIANAVASILDADVRVDTPIPKLVDKVVERLRPKPKFAEGQVVFDSHYGKYNLYEEGMSGDKCRALTPTEMGPLVLELFKYVKDSETSTMSHTYAVDLIKRFKEVHNA